MKKTSFNFEHIKRNYPFGYAKLMSWFDSDKEMFIIACNASQENYRGFYWLYDFFDQFNINIKCYPSQTEKDTFVYFVHSPMGSATNEILGTWKCFCKRRDAMREGFLGAFMFLERQLNNKKQ